MNISFRKLLVPILLLTLINEGCKKENLTPTEMLIGKWQLVSIQGSDTVFIYNSIRRILTFNYDHNPLIITYDSITTKGVEKYNLLFQLEFHDDGTCSVTEEYSTLDNVPIYSNVRERIWVRDGFKIDPDSFILNVTNGHYPLKVLYPEIFLSPVYKSNYSLLWDSSDISTRHLTLHYNHQFKSVSYGFVKL